MTRPSSKVAVLIAFAAVYVIWGSTYLAIRFAVEDLPPFLMAGARFGVAGGILYGWCRLRGVGAPTRVQWRDAAVIGSLLLLGGNGLVTWAEQWVPSGLAALLVASVPLWMALLSWVMEPANRPGPRGVIGLVLGFIGVGILVNPAGQGAGDPQVFLGLIGLLVASALWACGSLYSRRVRPPKNAFLSTGMQMLAGSAGLFLTGTLRGEWAILNVADVSLRAWLSVAYLIVFGAIIAFSAYVWLLQVSTAAKVSTYAYVNPIVAVALGWSLGGETVATSTMIAAGIVVAAVAMITTDRVRAKSPALKKAPIPQTDVA